ncbi:hypothetical protein Tco_1126782, partial [Tanacetum coccineum]
TGPNWMFDLDFLTNSINYIPVSVKNQVNVDAGIQDSYVVGSLGKDKGPTHEYILLPLQPHRTRIPIEDVPPAAHEKSSKSSPKDNDVQDLDDAANKESEQDLQDELEMMVTQELAAKAMDDISRQAFEEEKRRIASQKKATQATSTNKLSTDRNLLGNLLVLIGNLLVLIGHLLVLIGHLSVLIGHLLVLLTHHMLVLLELPHSLIPDLSC